MKTIICLKISVLLSFELAFALVDHEYCAQLSEKSLSLILGQAFNPRYMSIKPPKASDGDITQFGFKRSFYGIPFYADDDIVSLGDYPAWETNHYTYFEKKGKETLNQRNVHRRNIFVDKGFKKTEIFKSRPWECSSKINWIDLGANYFPRYVRTVECIAKKCWYGHFNCKPKSFAIKVLRKKNGSCIRVSDQLIMITSDKLGMDFTELWIWEELAINFCCECVMIY